MGPTKGGHGLWWKVLARNKRSVTLDLRREEARPLVEELLHWADVVIVTFRAGTAKRFALDWDSIRRVNSSVIMLQITGYGATSSRNDEPGFGKMGEARSGVVHLTGFPDGPPVHTGFSHADSLTGLMGAFAVMAALHRRNQDPERCGEWIDLALSDTLFRLIEWQAIVYDQLGLVPNRAGNRLAVAPEPLSTPTRAPTTNGSPLHPRQRNQSPTSRPCLTYPGGILYRRAAGRSPRRT